MRPVPARVRRSSPISPPCRYFPMPSKSAITARSTAISAPTPAHFSEPAPGPASAACAMPVRPTIRCSRWHGFIDLMYRNFCALHPGACPVPSPADATAQPWMADNATDIADNGTVPSPGTHWISPDVWNSARAGDDRRLRRPNRSVRRP